jgi:predicted RNase H-like HicB family nuclease
MEYIYPAIFHTNNDGSYTITFPDLPGCISEGKSLGNALGMAQSALSQCIEYQTDKKQQIPHASDIGTIHANDGEFVDRKSTRLNSSHSTRSRMPSSA